MIVLYHCFYIKKHPEGFAITQGNGLDTYLLKDGYLLELAKDFYCRPYVHGHGLVPDMEISTEQYLSLPQSAEKINDTYNSTWLEVDMEFVAAYNKTRAGRLRELWKFHKERFVSRIQAKDFPPVTQITAQQTSENKMENKCKWEPAPKDRIRITQFKTEPVYFDSSLIPEDYPFDGSQKIIDQFMAIGFEVISQKWEDVWGQGDGKWNHFVLRMGDIKIESTIQGFYLLTVDSRGN